MVNISVVADTGKTVTLKYIISYYNVNTISKNIVKGFANLVKEEII